MNARLIKQIEQGVKIVRSANKAEVIVLVGKVKDCRDSLNKKVQKRKNRA